MAPDVCRGLRNSSKSKSYLKKGPWTSAEDALLIEYVKTHGGGNWNAVQKHSGLMRCGKSCRLRWANHLRPDLKKGAFTPEEEMIIIDLHFKFGNKWARMASQLPGRTDNEIKNYWNTRLKRRQRMGLPIYPHEEEEQQRDPTRPENPNPNPFTFPPSQESGAPYLNLYRGSNGGMALALDSSSSFVSSLGQGFLGQGGANRVSSLGLPEMGMTPASSDGGGGGDEYEVERGFRGSSGLLGDLFGESPAVVYNSTGKLEEAYGGDVHESGGGFGYKHGIANSDESYEGTARGAKGSGDSNNVALDDDLMNLLNSFPLAVPIPEWNEGDGSESTMLTKGTNGAIGSQQDASGYNPVASFSGAANQGWSFGLWNNMPRIY